MLTERYPDVKWTKPFIATGSTCPDALRRPSNYRQGDTEGTWCSGQNAPVSYRQCRYILYMRGRILSFLAKAI